MKNVVKCYKDFFDYFNALKTHCALIQPYSMEDMDMTTDYTLLGYIWDESIKKVGRLKNQQLFDEKSKLGWHKKISFRPS